jgi:hypothetical protein
VTVSNCLTVSGDFPLFLAVHCLKMSEDTDLFAAPYTSSVPDLTRVTPESDIQFSQYTLESALASDLTEPDVPKSLQKVSRDWVMFSDDTKVEFIIW